jgi:type IV pilus assembly protein PilM
LKKLLKNEPVCIGLDVGSHSVKCAKIRKGSGGVYTLSSSSVEAVGPQKDLIQRAGAVQRALQAVGAEKNPVIAAVGGPGTVLRSVVVPKMTPEELKTALTFEAEKYIPFKLNEVFIDSAILGDQPGGPGRNLPGGRMEIALGAARKELVQGLLEMLTSAGTAPAAVDLEAVALADAWEVSRPTSGAEPVGLVHIGARGTILSFFKEAQLQFTREIPLGGDSFAKEAAEGSKEQWHSQCRASFDFYESQFGQRVERLYLSGGAVGLEGFREWVQEAAGLSVEAWNPLSGLQTSLSADQVQAIGPSLAVAVGLGVRGVR